MVLKSRKKWKGNSCTVCGKRKQAYVSLFLSLCAIHAKKETDLLKGYWDSKSYLALQAKMLLSACKDVKFTFFLSFLFPSFTPMLSHVVHTYIQSMKERKFATRVLQKYEKADAKKYKEMLTMYILYNIVGKFIECKWMIYKIIVSFFMYLFFFLLSYTFFLFLYSFMQAFYWIFLPITQCMHAR